MTDFVYFLKRTWSNGTCSYANYYETRNAAVFELFNPWYWSSDVAIAAVEHKGTVPDFVFIKGECVGYSLLFYRDEYSRYEETSSKFGILAHVLNPANFGCRLHVAPRFKADETLHPSFFKTTA